MKTKEELENTYQDYKTGAIITGFIGGILMIGGSVGIALTIGDPGPLSGSSTVFILGAMSGCYTTWGTYRAVKYRQKLAAMDIERGNAPAIEMNRAPAVAAAQAPVISPDLLEAPVKSSPAPVIASNSVSSAQQRVYNVDAILKGLLDGSTDFISKYPQKAEQLLRGVCLIGLKSDDEIKAIINNTFDGKLPSERNLKGLTQDLKNINVFANKSGEELRLVGAYSNAEIPPMIESAVLKAILAEVKVAKEEKSSLVLESSSDSTTVSVDAAEMKNSPRIPAALSASSNGSGIGR